MALTKVTGQVIKNTTDVTVGVLTVTNTLAVGGTVSIGGTLTYEDVTNVDAVGLITARNGIVVGSGITLSKDGDIFATGITTVSGNVKVGTGITLSPDGDGFFTGVITATSYAGDGSALTGIDATQIVTGNTSVQTVDTGSDGHVKVNTEGSERLRINSTGNMGLGVSDPNVLNEAAKFQELTLGGKTEGAAITLKDTDGNVQGGMFTSDATGAMMIRTITNHPMIFRTNNTDIARFDSSGRLLIGTTTEGHTNGDDLTIATSGGTGMTIRSGTSDTGSIFFSDGTSGAAEYVGLVQYDHANNFMRFYAGGSEQLRVNSSGHLLLGTTTAAVTAGKALMIAATDGARIKLCDSDLGVTGSDGYEMIASNNGTAYLWNRENTDLLFGTNNTEAMRIGNDGQVAIGADGASSPLHVKGITGTLGVQDYPQLTLQTASTNGAANTGAGIMFLGHDGSSGAFHGSIRGLKENGTTSNRNSYMSFGTRTNGQDIAERMRISSSSVGQVFIGCTAEPTGGNSGIMLQGNGFAVVAYAGSGSANVFEFNNSNNTVGRINCNGSNTSYLTNSDYRLKENESAISDGITRLKNLKPYRFNFKNEPSVTQDGFFAHEVSSAVPIAVLGDKDATKEDGSIEPQSIDHSKLVPLLTAALQEEISKRESLETRIAALEG